MGSPVDRRRLARRAGLLALGICFSPVGAEASGLDVPILFVQEPAGVSGATGGSRIVLLQPDGKFSVLTNDFAAAADPCVSFDGKALLCAGITAGSSRWDIWEMGLDGSRSVRPVRITENLGDCREPVYLPRAAVDSPDFKDKVRWITFTSTAPGALNDQGDAPLTSLYARNLDAVEGRGVILWRTTYNLGGDISPTVLSDGRILFSARQRGAFSLMAISWSGENLNPFYGSHDGFISQTAACELPGRTVVFIESERGDREAGGWLSQVSLRRPLESHVVLSNGDGSYRTPHPLPDGRLLVSWRDEVGSYGIYLFDRENGRPGTRIYDDPEWHEVDAMAVVPRPEPPGRIPMVEFASVLDVGSLREVGQLQCLNVYDSDRPDAGGIEEGQVKKVRLIEGVPIPSSEGKPEAGGEPDSTWPPPAVRLRLLGEAPVEEDGSFYVNVAGNTPFYMETLDARGAALQTMRAWMWVRTGDQRGCIGCHEDKELAPENRATRALISARPAMLDAPPEDRPWISFAEDGSPVLEHRCAGCHAGPVPVGPEP